MYNKKIKIANAKNVKLDVNVILDVITITVIEKLPDMRWHEVMFKKFTIKDISSYELISMIEEVLIEFANKKAIEDYIRDDIDGMDIKEIELPIDTEDED